MGTGSFALRIFDAAPGGLVGNGGEARRGWQGATGKAAHVFIAQLSSLFATAPWRQGDRETHARLDTGRTGEKRERSRTRGMERRGTEQSESLIFHPRNLALMRQINQ